MMFAATIYRSHLFTKLLNITQLISRYVDAEIDPKRRTGILRRPLINCRLAWPRLERSSGGGFTTRTAPGEAALLRGLEHGSGLLDAASASHLGLDHGLITTPMGSDGNPRISKI